MPLTPANIGSVNGFGGITSSDLSGIGGGLSFNAFGSHSSSRTRNTNTSSPRPCPERHSMECSSRPRVDPNSARPFRRDESSEASEPFKGLPCGLSLPQRAYDHYTSTSENRRIEIAQKGPIKAPSSPINPSRRPGKECKRSEKDSTKGSKKESKKDPKKDANKDLRKDSQKDSKKPSAPRTSVESSRSKRSAKPVRPQAPRVPMINEEETSYKSSKSKKLLCFN